MGNTQTYPNCLKHSSQTYDTKIHVSQHPFVIKPRQGDSGLPRFMQTCIYIYIYIKLSFRVHSKRRQHKSQAKLYIGLFISQAHLEGDLESYLEKSQRMLPSENPVKTSTSPAQLNKHMYWVRLKVTRLDERCKLVSFHGSQK